MSRYLSYILLAGDFFSLNLSILLALFWVAPDVLFSLDSRAVYLVGFSNLSLAFLICVSNPYNVSKDWGISKILKNQIAFIFIHIMLTFSLMYFFEQQYSIFIFLAIYLTFFLLFFALRVFIFYLRRVFAPAIPYKNFVIVGRNELANEVRRFYLLNPDEGYRFLGYINNENEANILDSISHINQREEIHEIFCCVSEIARQDLQNLIQFGLNSLVKVKLLIKPGILSAAIQLSENDRSPGINIPVVALDDRFNRYIKRVFDITFSFLFCLFVMSWLTPLIAILIKFDSYGPVFFVQLRSGEGNRPFYCLKFRTMKVNEHSDILQATKNDNRITKFGAFLRKSSIDELPQFFNVLIGNMSVVGPRPHMLKHTEEYSKLIDRFMTRQYIKPGITGLAQCLGYRGETKSLSDMANRVRLDRYYIENWTFWLDIKIIFLTIISLIRGSDKAY